MICKRLCKDINYYQLSNYKSDKNYLSRHFYPTPTFTQLAFYCISAI